MESYNYCTNCGAELMGNERVNPVCMACLDGGPRRVDLPTKVGKAEVMGALIDGRFAHQTLAEGYEKLGWSVLASGERERAAMAAKALAEFWYVMAPAIPVAS